MRDALTSFDTISNQEAFENYALRLFEYQYERNPVYRSYCDLINVNPSEIKQVKDLPFLPHSVF